jgi:hypothetical protein
LSIFAGTTNRLGVSLPISFHEHFSDVPENGDYYYLETFFCGMFTSKIMTSGRPVIISPAQPYMGDSVE